MFLFSTPASMAKQSLNYSFYQKVIEKMKEPKTIEIYSEPELIIPTTDTIIQENQSVPKPEEEE